MGHSRERKTVGVATSFWDAPQRLRFGEAVATIRKLLRETDGQRILLIIEAPLSVLYNAHGNPAYRFEQEVGHPWYCGPGATVCLGAMRLLEEVARGLPRAARVFIAEAFHPRADGDRDDQVAEEILVGWDRAQETELAAGCTPISRCIWGTPPVRLFDSAAGSRNVR